MAVKMEGASPPVFEQIFRNARFAQGGNALFEGKVAGSPRPQVVWTRKGMQMQGSDKHQMMYDEASGKVSLLIKAIGPGDEGEYTCTALNPYGEAICTVYISPEATKAVKKSRSSHKISKSKSNHDQQLAMQEQQQQLQSQPQSMQKSVQQQQQQSFQQSSSSVQQSSMQSSSMSQQQAASSSFSQSNSSFEQQSSAVTQQSSAVTQQSSSAAFQMSSGFQQSSSVQQSSVQQSSIQQSSVQQSSVQQSGGFQQQAQLKEAEPEVIYLKHVERQQQQQRKEETVSKYSAPVFMAPLKDVTVTEGERSHFEAKVGPVGDPSMVVEWYCNGSLIAASSRINTACQFGFVSMDMLNTTASDMGEYTCVVKSEAGSVQSACRLLVQQKREIESEMHSSSLKLVQEQQVQQVVVQEEVVPAPKFQRPLQNMGERVEGSSIKLEAQVTPSSDSSMKIDWFKDGQPITASSRIGTIFSFGYVSLNISDLRAEDAGTYTCRAVNKSGEDRTQAAFVVKASNSMTASTGLEEQHAYIQKTEQLEMYQASKMSKSEMTIEQPSQAPEFKTNIKDQAEVKEGGFAHFEARLEPMGDHSMNVQWLKDGQPVEASSRITSFFNFGYVALTVKQVALHDQGTYACVASNAMGRVETKAQLRCNGKADPEFQNKSWESVQKIEQKFESKSHMEIHQEVTSAPRFVSALKGTNVVLEGQKAHFECRVEPQNDAKMTVQWFFNGQTLSASSRIQTFHDFGYVAIDINDAKQEDSGTYTLVATNILGTQKAEVSLNVTAHAQVDYSSMHSKTVAETKRFEMKQEVKAEFEEVAPTGPPVFKLTLISPEPVSEGKNVHVEARLEPIGDPSMKVEWFFNGRPLTIGSRFKTYNDFGFIALDILGVTSLDAGQYVCRASNKLGETSTQATVQVLAKSNIVTETEHESAMQQISYLESEKVKKVSEEESAKVAPTFTKSLKSVEAGEGQNIHLEARLSPTGDSTMRVEWTVNGKPLGHGHRFRPAYDFDYVALDLLSVYPEDSGVYTCHAINAYGKADSSATIKVIGQAQVVSESRTEMKQFTSLETKTSGRAEFQEETTAQAPVFTSSPKSVDVREGQKAHFEARIIPVSDPTLKIEWFFNGQPIKQGSRFREGHDFGFVSLDISHVLPEDAGQYSCRATNNLGQAVCNANLTCKATGSLVKETIHESALQQINYLEAKSSSQTQEEGFTSQAPQFTAKMRDQQVVEGAPAHFEAKLVPIGDPKLKVEWLKDGKPIEASNRMSTLHDFGFVAMDLKYTRPADAGTYSIRAYNSLGDTTVSASLKVVSAQGGADMATMHGEALEKIAYLERHKAKMDMDSDEAPQTKPNFVAQLQGKTQLLEGQSAHLECRIDPYPDSSLRVEWFHNGKPLPFGNRWRTSYDFGFAALDILGAYAEDSGKYTIKATNILGMAESSVNIMITSGKGLLTDSDHQDALNKIKYLESKHQKTAEEEITAPEAPQFGRPLKNTVLDEGQPAHFETTLTPVNDASMKVDWFFNGKPVAQGHRFKTTYDFGFVALDILYAYPEDSGTYTCVAKNILGETKAECTLQVNGKAGLLLDTMDKERLGQLRNLEQRERVRPVEVDAAITKPVFTTPLKGVNGQEGAHIHLECRLEPVNDPNLKVEWFVNSKAIKIGSRFRTTHDFGYVALDVLQSYAEDSGTYMCKATNKMGEAVNTGSVTITARKGLLLDSQHPEGWEKMQAQERRQRVQTLEVEEHAITAPRFLTQLQGVSSLAEGQSAHFEAQIEPIHDPSLRVEFLHNGKTLGQASRIHTVCDFGYVALDIGQLVSSDGGEYICIAKNSLGECRSSVRLEISDRGSLDTSSQRPEGLDKIRQLESKGQKSRSDEVQTFQKPVFTTALQNVAGGESNSAQLAGRLIPVGDPSLRVEWLKDGKLLETGSRIKTSLDFGLVKLEIGSVRASDVGIYTCKAVNHNGEATSTTSIRVQDERAAGQEGAKEVGPPKFVTQVASTIEITEGQSAHFEARLTPTEDPNMKIEWFKDGAPLSVGNRWRTFHDFGIVILDILYCYAADSGTYECRATNKLGKDSTSGSVTCSEKSGLILTPQVPGEMREQTLQQIQHLESHKTMTSQTSVSASTTAPRFTTPISNIADLKEGENAHFEARLLPTDDSNMTIEWFWNGKALKAGSRIRTFCDFGFVILEISPVYPEDAGEYTCRAKNALGEAVTSATLSCSSRRNIILDSQLPSGMEGAMDRIAALEGLGRARGEQQTEEDLNQPPEFLSTLEDLTLGENALAHFETRLTPINDPSMKVEWFHNGKNLSAGSRIKTINDFGFVILEVANVLARDSGNYQCKAVNRHGEATISCQVQVKGRQGIDTQPQLPKSFQTGNDSIHNLEERMWKREEISSDEVAAKAPMFVTQPHNQTCYEGQAAHFDCRIEPIGDGSMSVEWYHDGAPIQIGSRIHTINDFGFVVLDIDWTFKRDTGVYKCVAKNRCGSAEVTANLNCKSKKDIIIDSQLPNGMSMERLKELEAKKAEAASEAEMNITVPKFITQIQSRAVAEGEPAHFECRVEPKNDPKLQIKWYHNGKEVDFGHRFRLTFEFGYVALDILYTYPEDEGEYVCKALNELGEDITRAELRCKELPAIQLENQVPKGMKKSEYLVQMEATMRKYTTEMFLTEEDVYDSEKRQPPRFVTQIQSITALEEMQATKFECQLAPVGDPNMKVEWFYNGKPLSFKTRFTPIYDFGYVAMNFGWVYPEDSGEYICRATNLYGADETRAIIKCSGKTGIVYESQLPKGMMSIERIREMESGWQRAPELLETETEKFKPCFVTKPEAVSTTEGGSARFCCRVTGYPKPRVMWLINGHTVINGSRHKLIYDGMWHLDIPKCQDRDGGKIEVIARNQCGEAYATTTLTCKRRRDDYRSVLKHNVKRDFINSDEYRKPEWLIKMEEIKERLAATAQAPKFIREIKDVRTKEGMRGKFEAGFAGNPKPDITWWFNGQQLQNSKNIQIKIRDDSTVLHIIDCGFDLAGYYECKAESDMGKDKCRASLTVNKMSAEEKEDYEKAKSEGLNDLVDDEEEKVMEKKKVKEERKEKTQKKEEKKVVKKVEVKKVESKVEEKKTYDWKKNVKKGEKKEPEPEKKPEKVELKKPKHIEKPKEAAQAGIQLKPVPAKDKVEEETKEEHKLKPVPQKQKQDETVKKAAPTELAPQKIAQAKEVKSQATKTVAVQSVEGPMKAMADIRLRLEHGASVNEVNAAYEAHEFPDLEKVEAQMAMIKAVERVGQSASVQEVLLQECAGKTEVDLQNVGFKALISTLSKESFKVDEVITQFQAEDFGEASVQERLGRLVTEAQEMDTAESSTQRSMAQGAEQAVSQETEVVREQRKVSFQQQTITSTNTTMEHMASAVTTMQESQTQVQNETSLQQEVALAFDVKEGDAFYALATFVSETGEAMNLVEGERVYVLEWNNADWWYVKKHLTEETGWVPAQYLKDEETYTMYVQRKLVEKIEKLPVFEKPKGNEKAFAPKITEKVKSQRSPDGAQVEFVCRVEGYPRPQITWFRQTAIIKPSPDFQIYYDENNLATLVIKEVFPEDAGTFTCVAKNCVGFASSSAELIVEHPLSDHAGGEKHDRRSLSRESSLADIVEGIPPTFAQRPSTKTAEAGTNVELECRFVAIPEAEVRWFYNKKEIKTAGRVVIENQADMHMYCSFVKISKVTKEDEGMYEVIAKNREGEATNTLNLIVNTTAVKEETKVQEVKKEEVKKVEVKKVEAKKVEEVKKVEPAKPAADPPVIVKPLTPTVCKVGDSVNIETVITGSPQPKLKWYHNGKHFKSGKSVKITENGTTFCLSIARAELKNDGDYTVKAENEAGTAQTSANICVQGEVIEFVNKLDDKEVKEREEVMLVVEVTSENTEVKWHKDGEAIQDTVDKGYKFERKGKKHSLIIDKATVHHEGEYVCSVGDQECSCEVVVVELPPEFTKALSTVKTTCGDKAVFEIEISKGDAKTKWFKKGVEIEFNENMQLIIEGKKQRLELYNVEVVDAGEITCTLGDKECKAILDVEEPNVNFVAKLASNTTGSIGQDVKITVNLTGSCNVKWMKEGKEIKESDKYQFECDGTTRTIIIKQASIEDVAEYTCVAETVRTSTELELEGQEQTIEFSKTEAQQTEQTIKKGDDVTFTVPFAGVLAQKPTVQWMYKSTEIKTSEKIITTITKKFVSITIKHVESIDCGVYTCKMQNSVSQVSMDFTLLMKDKPSPPRGPAQVTWKTEDTLSLQWVTPETDGGAKIEEFIVERKEEGKKSWRQVGSSSLTNIEIVGLKKDASYNFRIIARNSVGCSEPFIIEETFTAAKAEIPKSLPGSPSVSVTDVTSRSVTLNWNPPNDTGGVHLIGYIVEKRLSTSEVWERVETVESSVRIFTVENLKEKSEYFFRVSAENEVGAGQAASTDKVSLQTHARVPSAPTAPLEIVPVGPHSLTVEWGAPESDGGAPLEGYKIAVRDAKRQMWMEVGRVAAEVQKLTVKDLEEGCEYFIRIFAKNEVGFSDPLENEEPFKVVRPPGYTDEDDKEAKNDDAPSLSYSTTETLSSWMREANMDADISCYTKTSVLRRDEYFFRIWYYASKLFK